MSYTYIGNPYSGTPEQIKERFAIVEHFTAQAMKQGHVVFSPIVHCHEIAAKHGLPTDFKFWDTYCLGMLDKADKMIVLEMDGWKESKGLQAEIVFALENEIEIEYIEL